MHSNSEELSDLLKNIQGQATKAQQQSCEQTPALLISNPPAQQAG